MGELDLGNCVRFQSAFEEATMDSSMGRNDAEYHIYGHGAALIGHRVFTFGGYHHVRAEEELYVLDVTKMQWSARTAYGARSVFGRVKFAFVYTDMIYAFTLAPNNSTVFAALDVVCCESWTPIEVCKEFPLKDAGIVGTFYETKNEAVFFGVAGLFIYNLERQRWQKPDTKGQMPSLGTNQACCASPTSVFFSQKTQRGPMAVHELRMDTLSWSTIQSINGYFPCSRSFLTLSYIKGRIYAFGGYYGSDQVDVYAVREERWRAIRSSDQEFHGERRDRSESFEITGSGFQQGTRMHAAVHNNDKLFILGGFGVHFKMYRPLVIFPGE